MLVDSVILGVVNSLWSLEGVNFFIECWKVEVFVVLVVLDIFIEVRWVFIVWKCLRDN